mmetsp:Transcript_79366/g.257058  ORF Transcript_79366/g.257058 Transcript_79366/m.257058 type:complete len:201 (+) Transcript_79366:286-888(+)
MALQLPSEHVGPADADAGFANGAEQDFVHGTVHFIDNGHHPLHLPRIRGLLNALEEDGTSDAVWLQSAGPHLIYEHRPRALAAGPDRGINELVEGYTVGGQAAASCTHGLDGGSSALEVPTLQVLLDHRVVRDNVGHVRRQGLRHDLFSSLQVLAVNAGIKQCIVQAGRLFRACSEDLSRLQQATLGGKALEQSDLPWDL